MVGLLSCIPSQSWNACTMRAGVLQWLDQCCKPPRGLKQAVGKSFYTWIEKNAVVHRVKNEQVEHILGKIFDNGSARYDLPTLIIPVMGNSWSIREPPTHGPCESFGNFGNCCKICENRIFENNENFPNFENLWKNDQKCFVPLVNLFHRAVEHCSTRCLPVCRFFDLPM